jgi:hypothetical protein
VTLEGVIPANWTVAGVSGPGTAITAENSGNDGTIDWTGNGHFTDGATFVNRGTLTVQGDTGMYVSVPNFVDAAHSHTMVSGGADFSLSGNLSNSGTVELTNSLVTVSGNYAQAASGVLGLEITGSNASGELKVGEAATLAGALAVSKVPAYSPHVGDTQQVLGGHVAAGRFHPVTGTAYGRGLTSIVGYSAADGVTLVVHKGS